MPVHRPRAYVIGCLAGRAAGGSLRDPLQQSLFHGAAARAISRFGSTFESALKWWQVDGPSAQEFAEASAEKNQADIAAVLAQYAQAGPQTSARGWQASLASYCGRIGLLMPKMAACDASASASGPWYRFLPPKKKVLLYLAEKSWGSPGLGFVTDLAGAAGNGFCESGALPSMRKDSEAPRG